MSYQTSSKRSLPFRLLTGARKTQVFWHQSKARTAATVWNWSGKPLSPGALLAVLYFSSCHIFFRPFRLFLVPTICPLGLRGWARRGQYTFRLFLLLRLLKNISRVHAVISSLKRTGEIVSQLSKDFHIKPKFHMLVKTQIGDFTVGV